jgi:hypothetical protein
VRDDRAPYRCLWFSYAIYDLKLNAEFDVPANRSSQIPTSRPTPQFAWCAVWQAAEVLREHAGWTTIHLLPDLSL